MGMGIARCAFLSSSYDPIITSHLQEHQLIVIIVIIVIIIIIIIIIFAGAPADCGHCRYC